jgi:hypothetical protein
MRRRLDEELAIADGVGARLAVCVCGHVTHFTEAALFPSC